MVADPTAGDPLVRAILAELARPVVDVLEDYARQLEYRAAVAPPVEAQALHEQADAVRARAALKLNATSTAAEAILQVVRSTSMPEASDLPPGYWRR